MVTAREWAGCVISCSSFLILVFVGSVVENNLLGSVAKIALGDSKTMATFWCGTLQAW